LRVAVLIVVLLIVALTLTTSGHVFADLLQGGSKQRIGNYDVEMTTEPKSPTVGSSSSPTNILIRIAGVNGDHPADVPIMMRLVKDGVVLQTTNPIIVPYGHYIHEFTFAQAGRYVLYVDLNDYIYSGEVLSFTFFINVSGPFDYLYIVVPSAIVVVVGGIASMLVFRKVKKKNNKKNVHKAGRTELK
jgi:ABC-type antimicrobial peptide transport system permease subunit